MISFRSGDILQAHAGALVNTVNCVGVMGRGIALQFKNAFQDNYAAYVQACDAKQVRPGTMFVFERARLDNPRYIINFPTKRHWRGKSRIEDIETGLIDLVSVIRTKNIRSIAIPPLGSGLGGLNWSDVRPLIEGAMADLSDVEVFIYEPGGTPSAKEMVTSSDVPKMTPGRAALVVLMHRYLAGLLDPFVTLLEVHKLLYFMQVAGQPLRLQYAKASYGPYAENLRHLLRVVEGHLISGYADGGDAPDKQLELVPGAIGDADAFLGQHSDALDRFGRVADLVEGFESPFGLELLATVHWVATHDGVRAQEDVVRQTYAWGPRKHQFTPRQIGLALDVLDRKGWLVQPRKEMAN